jgi:hypothetical protein
MDIKDTSVIPVGYYCYGTSPCGVKGTCPYWSNPKTGATKSAGTNTSMDLNYDKSKWFAHCSYLNEDSDYNARDNALGGMSLIWDKVKECGQNPEPPPTKDESAAFSELSKLVYGYMADNNLNHVNIKLSNNTLKVNRNFHREESKNVAIHSHANVLDGLLSVLNIATRLRKSFGSVSFTKGLGDLT